MNILMVNKFYYLRGGAERYFFDLKKLLEKKGHKVIPFAMHDEKNFKSRASKYFVSKVLTDRVRFSWQGLRTVIRFFWSFEARKKMKKLLRENKIDLVHLHNIYHQISPSILPLFKKYKIPVVMTVHDYSLICPNYNLFFNGQEYKRACGGKYYECLVDRCVNKNFVQSLVCVMEMYWHHKILKVYEKNIDIFITPSKFVANKLLASGFAREKIKIVPHFAEIQKYKSIKIQKQDYILYFGRLSFEKGVHILIQALRQIPKVNLKIVGTGPAEQSYSALVSYYALQDRVEMIGHKSGEELKDLIASSKFIVLPSLAPETFGLSALEAFTLGKCVVSSKIGALTELIQENFLFNPGDEDRLAVKINWLTKDKKSVKMNGYDNLKKAQEYGPQKHFKALKTVYKSLIS